MTKIITGPEFRAAREKLGLSQVHVAELMHLPKPEATGYRTVSRWERGNPPGPALAHMEALASGWRPDWWERKGKELHYHA